MRRILANSTAMRRGAYGLITSLRLSSTTTTTGPVSTVPSADPAGSHPDFMPRMVQSTLSPEQLDEITNIKKDMMETICSEDVVLFMKGVPEAPVCGFSKKLVDVLEALGLEYTSFDALAHPVVRSHVKEISQWPTIPQLFIKGEFVGGIDVCTSLFESGELEELLTKHRISHRSVKLKRS